MFGLTPIPTFQAFVGLLLDTKYKLAMLIALNFVWSGFFDSDWSVFDAIALTMKSNVKLTLMKEGALSLEGTISRFEIDLDAEQIAFCM